MQELTKIQPSILQLTTSAKRGLDIIVSLLVVVCLLPLFALVCIFIVLDSEGSPFFVQKRVGLRGQRFKMYKFRSMYVNGRERLKDPTMQEKAEGAGRVLKLAHDPRVTRIGRILRSTSIDELPQLINVLLGHMSLVGPRALVPSMLAPYPEWAAEREVVKPGITGLWQVSARERNESLEDMIDYDLEYIRNWSLWKDLVILAKTPKVVFSRRGAV